jgi:hypothetical protein
VGNTLVDTLTYDGRDGPRGYRAHAAVDGLVCMFDACKVTLAQSFSCAVTTPQPLVTVTPWPGQGADCAATPGPTPTSAPTVTGWITEVVSQPAEDWNGRNGMGQDDQFIEIAAPTAQSLAGWQLQVTTTLAITGGLPVAMTAENAACAYAVAADNQTGPLKVFWGDDFACVLPLTGTVQLRDATGELRDTRTYQGLTNYAWAAGAWTYPAGAWWWYRPSPGH